MTSFASAVEDAIRAETEASSLTNWAYVYRSFRRFRHCDDGAIAEGYSSSTAHLLADSWGTAGELNRLVTQDKAFKQFVLRHIDELMSSVQARKIVGNANGHCPAHSAGLAKRLQLG
jgi:hypothetical protein